MPNDVRHLMQVIDGYGHAPPDEVTDEAAIQAYNLGPEERRWLRQWESKVDSLEPAEELLSGGEEDDD